ncbi:hypothetical protein [Lentzea sp. NPDC092896]|uniref:hypothetical protein n=1 Tax=Lentzea sp. NPDC092896 TaxID=3364127 RepID=UPI0037FAFB88
MTATSGWTSHGWWYGPDPEPVEDRPDEQAKCGGPAMCRTCKAESGQVVEPRIPEPAVRVTAYTVSCLPVDHVGYKKLSLTVSEYTPGLWAVTRNGFFYDQNENRYSESTVKADEEVARDVLFTLTSATTLAKRLAPNVKIGGRTVASALARAER